MLCIDNRDAALESEKIAFDPKVLNDNFKAINDTFGISMEMRYWLKWPVFFPISSAVVTL